MRPTQCAVFLKDRITSTALTADGYAFPTPAETACFLFDNVDEAQRFCEMRVVALPHLRCEVYDAEGLARPPLLVIVHPQFQRKEQAGSRWSRVRKLAAGCLTVAGAALLWFGVRSSNASDLAIFLAINCLFVALRFVYWDFGTRHHERERQRRLESHRELEGASRHQRE